MPLSPNTTILQGKYTIIRRLGKGAFARVWLAEDHAVGQQVAIKELRHAELSRDEFLELSRRFQREAKIGRALEHHNIIRVFTVEQWDEDLLLVMEYVEGETLRERLDRLGPMGLETALDVAVQLCAALDAVHAHALGIVHRDVKPSNILLTERGEAKLRAKLTDFGLAQLAAESGRSFGSGRHHPGTPLYMAPEQASGFDYLTGRADLYALGLTVGEMLVGRPVKGRLLEGETWGEILSQEPPWLAEPLARATDEDWHERHRQAGEFGAALQEGWRGVTAARQRELRDAQEQAHQEQLSELHAAAHGALEEQRWREALERCDEIAAIDPQYHALGQLRARAEAGLDAQREAAERTEQKQAELARLHAAAEAAVAAEKWDAVLDRCREMERLEPGYRDVAHLKAQAQARIVQQKEAVRRERQERAAADAASRTQAADQPSSKPFPWTAVLGGVAAVIVIVSVIWGTQSCGAQPTPRPTEPPPTPWPATDTPRPEPTATPRPTKAPVPPTLTPGEPDAGATRLWESDGSVMVYVPAGEFTMGSPEGEGADNEDPQHRVYLDGFWMDRTEVTNAAYGAFLNDRGNQSEGGVTWLDAEDEDAGIERSGGEWRAKAGYENHPVIDVSWYGAVAYCQWAGKRLPTEAEWEKAARGDSDTLMYPWGNQAADCTLANFRHSTGYCVGDTSEVGNYPDGASPYGVLDMAGSVWEWVADWYSSSYYSDPGATNNPTGPATGQSRVLRGGGWNSDWDNVRVAYRDYPDPGYTRNYLGFRCVAAAPGG